MVLRTFFFMSKTPLDKVKIKKPPTYYRYCYYYYYVIFRGNFPVFTYNIFVKKQKREKKRLYEDETTALWYIFDSFIE